MSPELRGLYAIADTHYLGDAHILAAVDAAITGGKRAVQYRDKHSQPETRLNQARKISDLCHRHGVYFFINDAAPLGVKPTPRGAPRGRAALPLAQARAQLGADGLIGVSCYND